MGYPQTGYPQMGYPQTGYPQNSPPQAGYPQAGYPQAGYPQAGYPQAGYPQAGYPQAGYPPAGYPQAGYPQQAGYPPAGYPQAGYPQNPAPYGGYPNAVAPPVQNDAPVGYWGGGLLGWALAGILSPNATEAQARKSGAILAGLGLVMIVLNVVMLFASGRYYPALVVVTPPAFLIGCFVVLTGKPRDMATGAVEGWWKIALAACAVLGLFAGIAAATLVGE